MSIAQEQVPMAEMAESLHLVGEGLRLRRVGAG